MSATTVLSLFVSGSKYGRSRGLGDGKGKGKRLSTSMINCLQLQGCGRIVRLWAGLWAGLLVVVGCLRIICRGWHFSRVLRVTRSTRVIGVPTKKGWAGTLSGTKWMRIDGLSPSDNDKVLTKYSWDCGIMCSWDTREFED